MSVLTVIPARLGATRLPRKPLRLLGGVPVVVRVYQRVQSLGFSGDCVVATDHQDILDACAEHGVPALLTGIHHQSGTDRVAEVAARPEFRQHTVILNVQGDEPFVSGEALRAAVAPVERGVAGIGTVAAPASAESLQRPDIVKVVRDDNGFALYFSRAPIPYLRESADAPLQAPLVRQHIGVYAYSALALQQWVSWSPHPLELIERLEQLRPLAHGVRIAVTDISAVPAGGIDTEEDLVRANARWQHEQSHEASNNVSNEIPQAVSHANSHGDAAATGAASSNRIPSTR